MGLLIEVSLLQRIELKGLGENLLIKHIMQAKNQEVPIKEFQFFDSYFNRNDCEFNPRQRRGDRKNIEHYIERIHEQVLSS